MMFAGQRRAVEQKASAVSRDGTVLRDAMIRAAGALKRDISSPSTLLTLFLAGLAFGALRPATPRGHDDDGEGDGALPGGRLAHVATALLSAVKLLELIRRGDADDSAPR